MKVQIFCPPIILQFTKNYWEQKVR